MGVIFPVVEGQSRAVKIVAEVPDGYQLVANTDKSYGDYDIYKSGNSFVAVKK